MDKFQFRVISALLLLIAILIGSHLAFQVHVHFRARTEMEQMKKDFEAKLPKMGLGLEGLGGQGIAPLPPPPDDRQDDIIVPLIPKKRAEDK